MVEEYGIRKDLLKTMSSAQQQIGKTIEMIKEEREVEVIHQQFLAVMALLSVARSTQFIHLLRNEIEKRTDEMGEHPHLNDTQEKELKGIGNKKNHYPFEDYAGVFDVLNKMQVELNKSKGC